MDMKKRAAKLKKIKSLTEDAERAIGILAIKKTTGIYLYTSDGTKYIDNAKMITKLLDLWKQEAAADARKFKDEATKIMKEITEDGD